jgi:hypothetical protein
MTRQLPIESRFISHLADHLCAESALFLHIFVVYCYIGCLKTADAAILVTLGTVTTLEEAVKWLSYTYLFIRMRRNPMVFTAS